MIDFFKTEEPEKEADPYIDELRALEAIEHQIDLNDPLRPEKIILTPRQEAYCLAYVETGQDNVAYTLAYGSKRGARHDKDLGRRRGSALREHPIVQARIIEIQRALREKTGVTVEWLTGQFREAIDLAKETSKAAAYVQALNGLMKLHGLGLERKEITVADNLRGMSSAELRAYEAEIEAELTKLQNAPSSQSVQ